MWNSLLPTFAFLLDYTMYSLASLTGLQRFLKAINYFLPFKSLYSKLPYIENLPILAHGGSYVLMYFIIIGLVSFIQFANHKNVCYTSHVLDLCMTFTFTDSMYMALACFFHMPMDLEMSKN